MYGGGDLTFDDWKEFAIVYLIIKIIVLTTQTKQIVKQFRELCADGLVGSR